MAQKGGKDYPLLVIKKSTENVYDKNNEYADERIKMVNDGLHIFYPSSSLHKVVNQASERK